MSLKLSRLLIKFTLSLFNLIRQIQIIDSEPCNWDVLEIKMLKTQPLSKSVIMPTTAKKTGNLGGLVFLLSGGKKFIWQMGRWGIIGETLLGQYFKSKIGATQDHWKQKNVFGMRPSARRYIGLESDQTFGLFHSPWHVMGLGSNPS